MAMNNQVWDVFLSYTHQDRWITCVLEQWLKQYGCDVCRDESSFTPNPNLRGHILTHIERSRLFLAVLSDNYLKQLNNQEHEYGSRIYWLREELAFAEAKGVPILFASTDGSVPPKPYLARLGIMFGSNAPADWPGTLWDAVAGYLSKDPIEAVNAWFTRHGALTPALAKQVDGANMAYQSLCVGSAVELLGTDRPWRWDEMKVRVDSDPELEPELKSHLGDAEDAGLGGGDLVRLLSIDRGGLTDQPLPELTVCPISYELVRTVGKSIRLTDRPIRNLFNTKQLAYPHAFVAHLLAVTADNYLLLGHRSERPDYYPNCWTASFEEHISVSRDRCHPSSAAIRAAHEEMALSMDKGQVTFMSVFRECDEPLLAQGRSASVLNTGVVGLVRLPTTIDDVWSHWMSAEDQGEFRHLVGVPFNFRTLMALYLDKEFDPRRYRDVVRCPRGADTRFPDLDANPAWRAWHPTARFRIAVALKTRFRAMLEKYIQANPPTRTGPAAE